MNLLAFLFLFLNLYSPLSTNITLVFNISLSVIFLKRSNLKFPPDIIVLPFFITIYATIITCFFSSEDINLTIIGRYSRIAICFLTFPSIIGYFIKKDLKLFDILLYALYAHCVTVFLQLMIPGLEDICGSLFRFERDDGFDMEDKYTLRRIGLTGGFDTSAFYCVCCTILSLIMFIVRKKIRYLAAFIFSLISTLFTSRTGMMNAVLFSALIYFYYRKQFKHGFFSKLFLFTVIVGAGYYIIPIILGSLELSTHTGFEGENYGTHSMDLFTIHLLPLSQLSLSEIVFGYGQTLKDSKITWYQSDIGYVKQIYEVGLVGLVLIAYLYLKSMYMVRFAKKCLSEGRYYYSFFCILVLLSFIFNYKNLFMFQVSACEIFVICFVYLYLNNKLRFLP